MRVLLSKLFRKMCQPEFQNNIWTLFSAGTSAVFVSLMVLITVRIVGLTEAGMLSFAAAIAILLQTLVVFGVRQFQSTDIKQEFALDTYVRFRVFCAFLAIIVVTVFLVFGAFEVSRVIATLLFFLILLVDGIADVFMGDLQQKGNMRVAGRMRVSAFVSSFFGFTITIFVSRTLTFPLVIATLLIAITYFMWLMTYRNHFKLNRDAFSAGAIRRLTLSALPLVAFILVYTFLLNSPKYYLGFLEADEAVAIVSILVIPSTALNILSTALFTGAELTATAKIFINGADKKEFSKRMSKQLLLAISLSIFFMICVRTFGLPLLSWIYGVDLGIYFREFMLLSLGGSFVPLLVTLGAGIVVMRMQKAYLLSIVCVAIISIPVIWNLVYRLGVSGAAYSFLIFLVPLTLFAFVICRFGIKRHENT